MKITNSFYEHNNIHTDTWSARNSKAVTDYFIANRKLSELSRDVRVYRRSDIRSDHFLTLTKLRFLPKWLHLPKNNARKEKILHYKIRLHNIEPIRWLCKLRIQKKLQEIPKSSNIVLEWRNTKTIISQVAEES